MLRKILMGTCILLAVYLIMIALRTGIGNTFLLFFGALAALAIYAVFFETLKNWRWLNRLIAISAALYIGLGIFAMIYGRLDTATFDEDIAIVLGTGIRDGEPRSSLINRLEAAVEYHRRNPKAYIIVSGGIGRGEVLSEAEVMAAFLIERGVPHQQIIQEGNSHSTYENMILSRGLVSGNPSVAVISNDFHIYRGTRFATIAGFENVSSFHAQTPLYAMAGSLIREVAAIVKMWVVGT